MARLDFAVTRHGRSVTAQETQRIQPRVKTPSEAPCSRWVEPPRSDPKSEALTERLECLGVTPARSARSHLEREWNPRITIEVGRTDRVVHAQARRTIISPSNCSLSRLALRLLEMWFRSPGVPRQTATTSEAPRRRPSLPSCQRVVRGLAAGGGTNQPQKTGPAPRRPQLPNPVPHSSPDRGVARRQGPIRTSRRRASSRLRGKPECATIPRSDLQAKPRGTQIAAVDCLACVGARRNNRRSRSSCHNPTTFHQKSR